ncbi:MAG: methyltransferase [Flavipsychrobacter sp.]
MSNNYFQFKQFKIEQAHCAMKVSTDACMQGAWTPIEPSVKRVLDIGTGTGLLSLMLAQRNEYIYIDAVELDRNAALQATDNIANAPWNSRVHVHHTDVKTFMPEELYDMVICNPPFFQNSLQGVHANRNMARHNDSLSYEDLFAAIDKVLTKDGYASIMLPATEFDIWEQLLNNKGWSVPAKLLVKPRVTQAHNRIIGLCRRNPVSAIAAEELCIYADQGYTNEFTKLMQPYYLDL